jgi:hypothetical protein
VVAWSAEHPAHLAGFVVVVDMPRLVIARGITSAKRTATTLCSQQRSNIGLVQTVFTLQMRPPSKFALPFPIAFVPTTIRFLLLRFDGWILVTPPLTSRIA